VPACLDPALSCWANSQCALGQGMAPGGVHRGKTFQCLAQSHGRNFKMIFLNSFFKYLFFENIIKHFSYEFILFLFF
jgi:hypothetical protein